MLKALWLLSLCAVVLVGGSLGCTNPEKKRDRKPRSTARIYEGDAPSIRITGEQSPGGKLTPYR